MCLEVIVGSARPFAFGPPEVEGAVAPAPLEHVPTALAGCAYVARLVDWHGGRPYCSCVFIEESLPWEPKEESAETVAAFDVLRGLAEEHGADLRVIACDDDDRDFPPNVHCVVAPRHIRAGMILFSIPFNGGAAPSYIVTVDTKLRDPVKPETLDVL